MLNTYIYILKCPLTQEVRYVGKTNNPKERYYNHLNKAKDINTHKRNWINKLRESNLKPVFEIIDTVSRDDWHYWEKFYIAKYIRDSCNLTNCTNGGDGLTFGNQTSFQIGNGAIPIVCLDLDGSFICEYSSVKEAQILTKSQSIYNCILGRQKKALDLIWIKKDDYVKLSLKELEQKIKELNTKMTNKTKLTGNFIKGNNPWNKGKTYKFNSNSKKIKAIYKIDKDTKEILKEYDRIADAIKEFGRGIEHALAKKTKIAYGYLWRYKNDD